MMAGVEKKEEVIMEGSSTSPTAREGSKKTPRSKSAPTKRKPIATTVPKPFNLGLNKRIQERQQFQAEVDRRQREAEKDEMIRKEEMKAEDERELKEYRRSLDFKATPIRRYRDITINPSDKELTYPSAPPLASTTRIRRSSEGGSSIDDVTSPTLSSHSSTPVSEAAPA